MPMKFQDFDRSYVDRLRSGDFSTQQHFVTYFGQLIRLKASKCLHSMEAIEDVRQETFSRVLRLLAEQRIHQPERLGALVNSVCNNVLHEYHRSHSRKIFSDEEFIDAIPDPTMGVPDAIARRQLQETVRQILDELPAKDCCLLKALFVEERSKDEVCREFAVNRDYLRVLLHRAKRSFKSHYLRRMRQADTREPDRKYPKRRLGEELRPMLREC